MTLTLARRPEQIRAEIKNDPERLELLKQATGELLAAVEAFIGRYVVLPIPSHAVPRPALPHLAQPDRATKANPTATTLALWVLHTWVLRACDTTPYLLVLSDEPGSGKTRLMETLSYIVRKAWNTANATPTTVFRRMSEDQPTLLLDEVDTIFRGGSSYEAMRQVINAGNRRGNTVSRCDGHYGTREYETFGAKILAGIDNGFLPATIIDRSITIHMSKRSGEPVARLRPRVAAMEAAPLANTLAAWALVSVDLLAEANPQLPASVSDRAADAWEPLLAIGELAGESWPERALEAAVTLSGAEPEGLTAGAPSKALLSGMEAVMGE